MKIYQVDSFTNEKFKGNPAGVMILGEELPTQTMQSIAMEMNLSETAFVIMKDNKYLIRFFTPIQEVPLCGHAALAAAHIMYEIGQVKSSKNITFYAENDTLSFSNTTNGIAMNLPVWSLEKKPTP